MPRTCRFRPSRSLTIPNRSPSPSAAITGSATVMGAACENDSEPAGGCRPTRDRGGRGGGRGGRGGGAPGAGAQSPDGKLTVSIRDNNLWVRDTAGKETQLTTDGVKDFGYATDNAGWQSSDRPIVRLVARFQEDRHLPAGPARRRRNVPGEHHGRPSHAARVEVPAARRCRGHHDPARHYRCARRRR